jgi:hypothetical protein
VRVDLLVGAVWRIEQVETMMTTSVEVGRMRGLSGVFNVSMIVAPDRDHVGVLDFPMGLGVVARGRLRRRPIYGSIGLLAGILVHRATTSAGVVHRVDPDFQLPIRFAWTIASAGLSVALIQGFSVRGRSYERQGVEVWSRQPYRIGVVLGLHFDVMAGRAKARRPGRRKKDRS